MSPIRLARSTRTSYLLPRSSTNAQTYPNFVSGHGIQTYPRVHHICTFSLHRRSVSSSQTFTSRLLTYPQQPYISLRPYDPPPSPYSHHFQPKPYRLRTQREPTRRTFSRAPTSDGYPHWPDLKELALVPISLFRGAERGFGYGGGSSGEDWEEAQAAAAAITATLDENTSAHGYAEWLE